MSNWRTIAVLITVCLCVVWCGSAAAGESIEKIAIIKGDDVRNADAKWTRFIELSTKKKVKVSLGIICESLANPSAEYKAWLTAQKAGGMVEFWNHGWDHKQWADGAKKVSEFGGSGYAHQKEHLTKAQEAAEKVLGAAPIAFGTPFNSFDADTSPVVGEDQRIRLVFCYKDPQIKGVVPALMALRGEPDGTGKPNAAKFAEEYAKKKGQVTFAAIQFHPAAFGDAQLEEYGKTLDILLADGWTFMVPSEYAAQGAKKD
jgi:hypothetical protein